SAIISGRHRIRLSQPSKLFRRGDPPPLEGRSLLSRRDRRRPQAKTPGGSALPCRYEPGRRNKLSGRYGGSGLWHSGGCLPGRLLKAHSALETTVLLDLGCVDRILPAWAGLWERCVNATSFQRPEWLRAWMACFQPQHPFVIVVWLGTQIVGLAPLLIYRRDGQRVLALMGGGVSDYLDVLIDPSFAEEALAMIWERIKREASK